VTIVELNKIKLTETSKLNEYLDAELRTWDVRPDLPNSTNLVVSYLSIR